MSLGWPPFASYPSQHYLIHLASKLQSARGLAEFLLADDHLLLHEDNLPGVDGVVVGDDDVEASLVKT